MHPLFGTASVLQYQQMYAQTMDESPGFPGFDILRTIAGAILDRTVHHGHRTKLKGDSMLRQKSPHGSTQAANIEIIQP